MVVLTWVGQILLFLILWRVLHWLVMVARRKFAQTSLFTDLVANFLLSVILVVMAHTVRSAWWELTLFGAIVGVITGLMASRGTSR